MNLETIIITVINTVALLIITYWRSKSRTFEKSFNDFKKELSPFIKRSSVGDRVSDMLIKTATSFIEANHKLPKDYKSLLIKSRNYLIDFSNFTVNLLYGNQQININDIKIETDAIFDMLKIPTNILVGKDVVLKLENDNKFKARIHSFNERILEVVSGKYNGKSIDRLEDILSDFMVMYFNAFVDKID